MRRTRWIAFASTVVIVGTLIACSSAATVATDGDEMFADRMAAAMVLHMSDLSRAEITGSVRTVPDYNPQQPMKLPEFLGAA